MGGREVNNTRHGCAIWPCTTHSQDTQAWENSQARPKIAKFETHGLTLISTRACPRPCGPPLYKQITVHFLLPFKSPTEISPSPLPDPYSQPPLPSRPVHVAASYANISEHLTRFKFQCFQEFNNIDATLQQSCQHLPISLPVPPRKPSSDEDL
ncbi:hypothetical protein GOBAR_AA10644 [Gossypium barbadense]|uniref:Uncharacterized protein n=1 Tax=Gossypium barbadense TaxID=3634 RepID=A0A2P5Y320_GOSBA|nr:hypothetical protein GOBAR_AA10644 [Gossypium barbadense]